MTSLAAQRQPLPPSYSVRAARDAYLDENGFDTAGYTAETFDVEAFGRRYTFANTKDRKWAIPLHDLHHVATGYGTDLIGEAEVGAFELVGGCRTTVVYALNIIAVLMGFFVAPVRTLRAFAHARRVHARALYASGDEVNGLLDLSLGDLRGMRGLPHDGLNRQPRRLHDDGEARRADALPSAPPQPWWVRALGIANGLATAGAVAFLLLRGHAREARLVAIAVGVAGLLLAASAPALCRGSLGARAVFGHAAFAIVVLQVVSVACFQMAPFLAAGACAVPLLLLWRLMR